jgi:glycine/serine hydroxymethyltransferase
MIDVAPANLSANNIVSETITAAAGSAIVNNYAYAYNASQYPVKVTATYGGKETVATVLEWAE